MKFFLFQDMNLHGVLLYPKENQNFHLGCCPNSTLKKSQRKCITNKIWENKHTEQEISKINLRRESTTLFRMSTGYDCLAALLSAELECTLLTNALVPCGRIQDE